MRKIILFSVIFFSVSQQAQAVGLWDSLKSLVGLGDKEEVASVEAATSSVNNLISVDGLLGSVTENLGVTNSQATGGMAALMDFAKGSLSDGDFSEISSALPGMSGLLSSVPEVSKLSGGAAGELLGKASEYSDKLQLINQLKSQFESLGLDPAMISKYVSQATTYLDTPQGQKAKEILSKAFSSLSGL